MKKTKSIKVYCLSILAFVCAFILVSCGGSTKSNDNSAVSDSINSSEAVNETDEATTYHYYAIVRTCQGHYNGLRIIVMNGQGDVVSYDNERDYSEDVEDFIKAHSIANAVAHYLYDKKKLDARNPSEEFLNGISQINLCLKYVDDIPLDNESLGETGISPELYKVMEKEYYNNKNLNIYENKTGYGYSDFSYNINGYGQFYALFHSLTAEDVEKNNTESDNIYYELDKYPEGTLYFNISLY